MERINKARFFIHNKQSIDLSKDYILYWMQAAVRVTDNHALLYALIQCKMLKKPLVIYFGLTPSFPHANLRHYTFLLQGLAEVEKKCKKNNICFVARLESPEVGAIELSKNAVMVITDNGALRIQRQWRDQVAVHSKVKMITIETNLLVPPWVTSNKEEYAARTIRPKIHKVMNQFIEAKWSIPWKNGKSSLSFPTLSFTDIENVTQILDIDRSVGPVNYFLGGEDQALKRLKKFIQKDLPHYQEQRSDPSNDCSSKLSPYLHFGQISPLTILRELRDNHSAEAFIEELIVRRELAFNFAWYNSYYDQYRAIPAWAQETLEAQIDNQRPYTYTRLQMERGKTHDPYWNACQKEMTTTGFMHGYMRMYWGKKIIEWSKTPQKAFETMIFLNDKYQLDGRDPNGYCGIAWCFGKHDRPWTRRTIFGTVRYMNDRGLERKFNMQKYIERIKGLENGQN